MKAEDLRKSILQLAIQGKLVPQDPNDEPASVLLERIRAEKQKLIKEGKIKKDKGDSIIFKGDDNRHYEKFADGTVKCIEDELPFEIPESWCWIRLPQLVHFELGKTPDRHADKFWNKGIYPWFSIADMQDRKVVTATKEKISDIALREKFNNVLSPKGTLLMSFKLTVGRTSVLGVDAVHNEAIISIYPYINDNNITRNYLMNILGLLVNYVEETDAIKGATLNSSKLKSMFVPLPPLSEQARIVAEIEKYEPLIAEYDKLEQQATKLDDEIYDNLKKSILQYAIQGKLVPQDPNDEPASVLLARIRAEKKAQLGKKYVDSYIYKGDDNCYYEHINGKDVDITDEIPFDLPSYWSWARVNEVISLLSGRDLEPTQYNSNNQGVPYITGASNFIAEKLIINRWTEQPNVIPKKNDLLITCKGTIGETAYNPYDKIHIARQVMAIHSDYLNLNYIERFLKAYITKLQTKARSFIPGISRNDILELLMPIPPLAEQKRIVKKIDEIFAQL